MALTDTKKKQFLIKLLCQSYSTFDDDCYACKTNSGDGWVFGFTNDYPLQHGKGKEFVISDKILEVLIKNTKSPRQ